MKDVLSCSKKTLALYGKQEALRKIDKRVTELIGQINNIKSSHDYKREADNNIVESIYDKSLCLKFYLNVWLEILNPGSTNNWHIMISEDELSNY